MNAERRKQISDELSRLLAEQTEFFKKSTLGSHTRDELDKYEESRAGFLDAGTLARDRRAARGLPTLVWPESPYGLMGTSFGSGRCYQSPPRTPPSSFTIA